MNEDTAAFTRTAARMVAANDRSVLRRRLWGMLARAFRRTGVAWSAVAVSAVAIYNVPPYTRFYG